MSAAVDVEVEFERPEPSAPSLPEVDGQTVTRNELFRRLYLLLTAHVTLFTALTVLFVYV